MRYITINRLSNDKGLTLIEILASIVILSIIVVTFLSMFIQSARTNNVSETIIDATYVAQEEMEEIYNLSKPEGLSDAKLINSGEYDRSEEGYSKENRGYYSTIEIKENGESEKLANVIIRVFNTSTTDKVEAQMEGVFRWTD